MWAERILELQKALVQSRQVSEKLCADLEAPSTADRWKALGGQDPPAAELKAKVEVRDSGGWRGLLWPQQCTRLIFPTIFERAGP